VLANGLRADMSVGAYCKQSCPIKIWRADKGVGAYGVRPVVADVLGAEPLGATHMDFGHMSVTYEVALPDRQVMVWQQLVQAGLDKHTSGVQGAELGRWERRVRGLARSLDPYLRQVVPMCFLDDVTIKNVIVQGGELQGNRI